MMEELFLREKKCLMCGAKFKSPKVKRSKQRLLKKDSDFCAHYEGENPSFYNAFVCPTCGYGFTDNFKGPGAKSREVIKEKIKPFEDELNGPRTVEKAIQAYSIALKCALMGEERKTIIAGLYLHLAWFNRFREDKEEETKNLGEALKYYEDAIESERDLEDPATIFYLIGEISGRLGDKKKAVNSFSRIVNDKEINNPNIIRMARERWQEMRAK